MADLIDAYYELLQIPPSEQPPNHYRLLGVNLFETSRDAIINAAAKQSKWLRSVSVSQYGNLSQQLLNEIAGAKLCLLNEAKRAVYDRWLKQRLTVSGANSRSNNVSTPGSSPPTSAAPAAPSRPAAAAGQPQAPAEPQRGAEKLAPRQIESTAHDQAPSDDAIVRAPAPPDNSPSDARQQSAAVRDWIFGRASNCDIVVDRPGVSSIHCRLTLCEDGAYWIEDLGSTNGTRVNGVPISGKVRLSAHEQVTLGKTSLMPWPTCD